MFTTLEHLGFHGPFLRAIKHLYNDPSASIKTLFAVSPPFTISNGTRQGCPFSPLLFTLCIEPLAAQIHCDPNVHGVLVRGREFKIFLFGDNLLLTLTLPSVSLPNLHKLLEEFGFLSDYRINPSKS